MSLSARIISCGSMGRSGVSVEVAQRNARIGRASLYRGVRGITCENIESVDFLISAVNGLETVWEVSKVGISDEVAQRHARIRRASHYRGVSAVNILETLWNSSLSRRSHAEISEIPTMELKDPKACTEAEFRY